MHNISRDFLKLFINTPDIYTQQDAVNSDINIVNHFVCEDSTLDTFNTNNTPQEPLTTPDTKYSGLISKFLLQNGDFDTSKLLFDNLQTIFPASEFNIKEEVNQDNGIMQTIIYNKAGVKLLSIDTSDPDNNLILAYNSNDEIEQMVRVDSDGNDLYRETYTYTDNGDLKFSIAYMNGNLFSKTESDSDGNRLMSFYNDNGEVDQTRYWSKDTIEPDWEEDYENDIAWRKSYSNGTKDYPIVFDLAKSIEEHLYSDEPDEEDNFATNILKGITTSNINEILKFYEDVMNVSLFDSINFRTDIPENKKQELIAHLEKTIYNQDDTKIGGTKLAKDIYKDIVSNNCKDLNKLLNYANRDTLKYVITQFRQLYTNDNPNSYQLLLGGIANDETLSLEEKNRYIQKIIDIAMEGLSEFDKASLKKDMSEHMNDIVKIEIDIMRALNKTGGDLRNKTLDEEREYIAPNGKLDEYTKQGKTGDCWLVAGVNSLNEKPLLKAALESLYEYDEKTGTAIVHLNGVGKTYTITKEEFENSEALSSGDGDMRAFEIAIDKYIKETGYDNIINLTNYGINPTINTITNVDINANVSSFLFNALLGDKGYTGYCKAQSCDFNDERTAFVMSLSGKEEIPDIAKDSNDEDIALIPNHAYSIVGSDDNNVYLLNPWDSSNILTVSRENFNKLGINIEYFTLNQEENLA